MMNFFAAIMCPRLGPGQHNASPHLSLCLSHLIRGLRTSDDSLQTPFTLMGRRELAEEQGCVDMKLKRQSAEISKMTWTTATDL